MAQLLKVHTGPIEDPSLVQFPAPLQLYQTAYNCL